MLSRLLNLLKLDATLLWRNKFVHVSLLTALIFVVLVNLIIPGELKAGVAEYVFDNTEDQVFADFLARDIDPRYIMNSEQELRQRVGDDTNSVGIILGGSPANPQAVLLQQGHEHPKSISLLAVALDTLWEREGGVSRPAAHSTSLLYPEAERIPFNLALLPILIALESVLLGFYFAAVMVFQEKDEGGIKAYRVSPGGVTEYIASKVLVNVGLGLLSGLLIVGATVGLGAQYGQLIILIAVAAAVMTLLGLGLGVFFASLSGFIYPALLVATVMTLPLAFYLFPAFNLPLINLITTYPVMFGLREILFPAGRPGLLAEALGILLPQAALAALFCYLAVKRRLMQEVA